ncbi:MAG: DUF2141 domain-containing protein [Proteobacteria bacterium]|nr:DUF2141 domain-containing protein [Pseudomonadota bacterium]
MKPHSTLWALTFLLGAIGPTSAEEIPSSATISISLASEGKPKGTFVAALFTTKESFLKDAVMSVSGPVQLDGTGALVFGGVTPGLYAISVFHDKDSDGKLDTNFIGIPSEPVGVSNNPKARMGSPRFEDAKFVLEPGVMHLQIKLE